MSPEREAEGMWLIFYSVVSSRVCSACSAMKGTKQLFTDAEVSVPRPERIEEENCKHNVLCFAKLILFFLLLVTYYYQYFSLNVLKRNVF